LIVDQNGNPVPDGTKVSFIIDTRSTSGSVEQLEAETVDGYARVMYVIPSIGSLELRVTAPPALTSQILRLDITDAGGIITSFEPTPVITQENEPVPTVIPPTPTPATLMERTHGEGRLAFPDWILASMLIFGVCFLFTRVSVPYLSGKWRLNVVLSMGAGGYLAYLYLALGLPGAQVLIAKHGTLFMLLCVCGGLILGLGMGWLLYRTRKGQK
jgi:beta-N-acetylhexosaminidase